MAVHLESRECNMLHMELCSSLTALNPFTCSVSKKKWYISHFTAYSVDIY